MRFLSRASVVAWTIVSGFFLTCGSAAQSLGQGGGLENFPSLQLPTPGQNVAAKPEASKPRIRLCADNDLRGLHLLTMVFETPEGEKKEDFKLFPYQYLMFNKDKKTFGTTKTKKPIKPRQQVREAIKKASGEHLFQFIINEKGVLFLYKDQVFSHSYYCGVVENNAGVYRAGDKILTPTSTDKKELFEVYRRF